MQTTKNINAVKHEIKMKTEKDNFMANGSYVKSIITDQDHHPYSRYFRGVYYFPEPIVMEREAGWRPLQNNCYDMVVPYEVEEPPINCYENACSTILPCYPSYETNYKNSSSLSKTINQACIVQYR